MVMVSELVRWRGDDEEGELDIVGDCGVVGYVEDMVGRSECPGCCCYVVDDGGGVTCACRLMGKCRSR